jgi:hypothetical protein
MSLEDIVPLEGAAAALATVRTAAAVGTPMPLEVLPPLVTLGA